jgi:hypothetical protein
MLGAFGEQLFDLSSFVERQFAVQVRAEQFWCKRIPPTHLTQSHYSGATALLPVAALGRLDRGVAIPITSLVVAEAQALPS